MVDFVKDLGYPEKFGYPHWGLYQPTLDRVLLVAGDRSQITKVRTLSSARMFLIICRLDQAENYKSNLIDNACCQNWTVSRDSEFDYTTVDDQEILYAQRLLPCPECSLAAVDVDQEKTWLEYVWYWTRFLDWLPFFMVRWYNQQTLIRSLLPSMFAEYDSEISRLEHYVTGIHSALFWSKDLAQCHAEIKHFMDRHSELKESYKKWSNHA